jgi:hypothetical protein
MSARVLPLAWVPTIGGLVCDDMHESVHGVLAMPSGADADISVLRTKEGFSAMLPMGYGFSERSVVRAIEAAARDQHERLRAERELGIADATEEHARARARRLCGDLLEMRGHSSCEHRGDALEVES